MIGRGGSRSVALVAAVFVLASARLAFSLEPFLMGISNKHISTAYLYVGQEQNFFAEEGIDLKLVFIPVSVAPTALVAQQIDGMEFASTGIQAGTRGAPLKAVFLQSRMPGWYLMSRPSITDLRQLPGKTVSVGTLGSGAHNMTIEILKKAGVDSKSVVFIAGRGGSNIRLQMLTNGTVQVANLLPPYTYIAEKQGFRELIFYGDYAELAQFGLIVHESSLKNKRSFLKRVVRAFVRSHVYTAQNPRVAEAWIVKHLMMSPEDAKKTVGVLRKISTENGMATEAAIQNALDETGKGHGLKTEALVDYSILREIQDEKGSK
jgi:ABC-type nitrate/sulfonate/bicarbonate transport system substrate-binding protein